MAWPVPGARDSKVKCAAVLVFDLLFFMCSLPCDISCSAARAYCVHVVAASSQDVFITTCSFVTSMLCVLMDWIRVLFLNIFAFFSGMSRWPAVPYFMALSCGHSVAEWCLQ